MIVLNVSTPRKKGKKERIYKLLNVYSKTLTYLKVKNIDEVWITKVLVYFVITIKEEIIF